MNRQHFYKIDFFLLNSHSRAMARAGGEERAELGLFIELKPGRNTGRQLRREFDPSEAARRIAQGRRDAEARAQEAAAAMDAIVNSRALRIREDLMPRVGEPLAPLDMSAISTDPDHFFTSLTS
jgi:hypothetical protein